MSTALRLRRPGDIGLLIRLWSKPVGSYSETKARSLYQRFANNHTWQTVTINVRR
jgi:hypothetical protein